jgi:lysophospholipase L1-like esterase
MSLPDVLPIASYTGNASTSTAYPFPFKVLAASHVKLYIDGVLSNDAITVTGVGDEAGVDVTTSVAYTSEQQVTLRREVPFSQETDLVEGGRLREESLEDALDYGVMQAQQLKEALGRTVQVAPGKTGSTLPSATNSTIGQDANGDLVSRTAQEEITHLGIGASVTEAAASAAAAAISETNAGASETVAVASAAAAEASNVSASAAVLDFASKSYPVVRIGKKASEPNITSDVTISFPGGGSLTLKASARPYTEVNAINAQNVDVAYLIPDIINIINGDVTDASTGQDYGLSTGSTNVDNFTPIQDWSAELATDGGSLVTGLADLTYLGSSPATLTVPLPLEVKAGATLDPPANIPYVAHSGPQTLTVTQQAQARANIGASESAIGSEASFIFEGDSITAGTPGGGGQTATTWAEQAESLSNFAGRGSFTTTAVSGSKLADMESRWSSQVSALAPSAGEEKWILFMVGINDVAGNTLNSSLLSSWFATAKNYVTRAQAAGFKVCWIAPLMRLPHDEVLRDLARLILEEGEAEIRIDAHQHLPRVVGQSYFEADNLHLNEEGGKILAGVVNHAMGSGYYVETWQETYRHSDRTYFNADAFMRTRGEYHSTWGMRLSNGAFDQQDSAFFYLADSAGAGATGSSSGALVIAPPSGEHIELGVAGSGTTQAVRWKFMDTGILRGSKAGSTTDLSQQGAYQFGMVPANGQVLLGSQTDDFAIVAPSGSPIVFGTATTGVNQSITLEVKDVGGIAVSGTVEQTVYTVATLPSASAGATSFVSDSTQAHASNSGSTVTGGGSNFVPVYYDGSDWRIS